MEHTNEITYENVWLRPLKECDIELLRNWRNNPDNSLYLKKIPYITPEMQKKWFEAYINNKDEVCFAIIEIKDLNRLAGSCSLYQFKNDECLFGKILIGDKDAHGRKIGLNATIAATRIAFEQLKMRRVKLFVYADNIVAYKIYSKAGFCVIEENEDAYGRRELTMNRESEGDF